MTIGHRNPTGGLTPHRFPLGPIVQLVADSSGFHVDEVSAALVADHLGVSKRSIERAIRSGGLTTFGADAAAVAFGRHPASVWGDLWWEAAWADIEASETAAAERQVKNRQSADRSRQAVAA